MTQTHEPQVLAGQPASPLRVLRDQRKSIYVGVALMVASFWVLGQLDRWQPRGVRHDRHPARTAQPPGHRALAAPPDHLG